MRYRCIWLVFLTCMICTSFIVSDYATHIFAIFHNFSDYCIWFVRFWPDTPSPPSWTGNSSFTRFLDHTQRHTTIGRTPLGEWSAHRRDLYLTTHSTHNRQTSMSRVGFEPTISAGERPHTYTLDRAATGTGTVSDYVTQVFAIFHNVQLLWSVIIYRNLYYNIYPHSIDSHGKIVRLTNGPLRNEEFWRTFMSCKGTSSANPTKNSSSVC